MIRKQELIYHNRAAATNELSIKNAFKLQEAGAFFFVILKDS